MGTINANNVYSLVIHLVLCIVLGILTAVGLYFISFLSPVAYFLCGRLLLCETDKKWHRPLSFTFFAVVLTLIMIIPGVGAFFLIPSFAYIYILGFILTAGGSGYLSSSIGLLFLTALISALIPAISLYISLLSISNNHKED